VGLIVDGLEAVEGGGAERVPTSLDRFAFGGGPHWADLERPDRLIEDQMSAADTGKSRSGSI
jgi:hypothetical protein